MKKIREAKLSIGQVIIKRKSSDGGKTYSYTVDNVDEHFVRFVCVCGRKFQIHQDDDWSALQSRGCCPAENNMDSTHLQRQTCKNFFKYLKPGEDLFNRYTVLFPYRDDKVFAKCKSCGRIVEIYLNSEIWRYCNDGTMPKRIVPLRFCCPTAQRTIDNPGLDKRIEQRAKKAEAGINRRKELKDLEEKGIIVGKYHPTLFCYKGGAFRIEELAEKCGISVTTIRRNLKAGKSIEDAVKINGIPGDTIVYEANRRNINLGALQQMIRRGMSLDDAFFKLEFPRLAEIAIDCEHNLVPEDEREYDEEETLSIVLANYVGPNDREPEE